MATTRTTTTARPTAAEERLRAEKTRLLYVREFGIEACERQERLAAQRKRPRPALGEQLALVDVGEYVGALPTSEELYGLEHGGD